MTDTEIIIELKKEISYARTAVCVAQDKWQGSEVKYSRLLKLYQKQLVKYVELEDSNMDLERKIQFAVDIRHQKGGKYLL